MSSKRKSRKATPQELENKRWKENQNVLVDKFFKDWKNKKEEMSQTLEVAQFIEERRTHYNIRPNGLLKLRRH